MTTGEEVVALRDARARLDRAHQDLVLVIDQMPGSDGETCVASAEVDAALSHLKGARKEVDILVARAGS